MRVQILKKLAKLVLEGYLFDEAVYQDIKSSSTRPKFLHIGLKFWELLGTKTLARESKTEVKLAILNSLLQDNFIKVFVRGLSIQNGVLFDTTKEVKASLI